MSLVLVYESKGLLIGEGVGQATAQAIRALIAADPDVASIRRLATMYLGPEDVMLAVEVHFRRDGSVADTRRAIDRMTRAIRARYPRIRHVFLDASSISG